ncbi:hypothetical protein [Candidatus Venteria ishoeyi]|uniref:Uncharacterized protein n=1 Tax=Candidatus Venteria ishoeyi TaxID=1899563 RepID=A0A1H6FDD6_9GAMM|nr:hypothetical protein [Candidatus Venteria ishoeyi]SEH08088.1 Uncharacterised protein [Candidatus Venteria ishoeyi]
MRKLFLLLILLISFAPTAYAACTNFPADLTEPNYGVTQWIGGGYESNLNTCLNGEKVQETGSSGAKFFVGLLTDYQVDKDFFQNAKWWTSPQQIGKKLCPIKVLTKHIDQPEHKHDSNT